MSSMHTKICWLNQEREKIFFFNHNFISVEITALTNSNNNNTYRFGRPSLASSWQKKIRHTSLNGPVYIYADITTPGLATNCCPGNGLSNVRMMECPGGHKTLPFLSSDFTSACNATECKFTVYTIELRQFLLFCWVCWSTEWISRTGSPSLSSRAKKFSESLYIRLSVCLYLYQREREREREREKQTKSRNWIRR